MHHPFMVGPRQAIVGTSSITHARSSPSSPTHPFDTVGATLSKSGYGRPIYASQQTRACYPYPLSPLPAAGASEGVLQAARLILPRHIGDRKHEEVGNYAKTKRTIDVRIRSFTDRGCPLPRRWLSYIHQPLLPRIRLSRGGNRDVKNAQGARASPHSVLQPLLNLSPLHLAHEVNRKDKSSLLKRTPIILPYCTYSVHMPLVEPDFDCRTANAPFELIADEYPLYWIVRVKRMSFYIYDPSLLFVGDDSESHEGHPTASVAISSNDLPDSKANSVCGETPTLADDLEADSYFDWNAYESSTTTGQGDSRGKSSSGGERTPSRHSGATGGTSDLGDIWIDRRTSVNL
ncbi:uncharacterized protein B0H18DRAFT_961517 [Fomitopsis serialis]|uniref:uncharacterized protein n=1 Tax=Fomitopsis serialis TaxID=139415 RepID=UPI002007C5EC|nr:uncharacterized protein B0H18DRAFT_961517 [Neoantrodia serialis]KAH9911975.1 hypothetical protein B0H18DRAFT_961517 [Neoantrodia serialis]